MIVVKSESSDLEITAENAVLPETVSSANDGDSFKHKKKSVNQAQKSPVMLLNESKKNIKYKFVSSDGPKHQPLYTFAIEMDDKRFTGQASSKKKAKTIAAIEALASFDIFVDNLDSDVVEDCDTITENSQESDSIVDVKQEPSSIEGVSDNAIPKHNWYYDQPVKDENGHASTTKLISKSPVQILNEIRPGIIFSCSTEKDDTKKVTFVISVVVDEIVFEGKGSNKKSAKTNVAVNVLINHFSIKYTNGPCGEPIFDLSTKRNDLSKYGIERPVTLTDLFPVKYEVVEQSADACKVSLNIEGTIIEGSGTNLKKAKFDANENALTFLREIGLYDSRVQEYREKLKLKRQHNNSKSYKIKRMKVETN